MNLNDAITQSIGEVFPMFGLNPDFIMEEESPHLSSGDPVNILIGFSSSIQGNMILGLTKETSLKLVSTMMGGMQIDALDEMVKSGLGEVLNMIAGTTFRKILSGDQLTIISPPTIVMGENLFIMISRVKSRKLFFKLGEETFWVSYCVE